MIYLIDGSLDGVFTAVFNAFLTKTFPSAISDGIVQLELGEALVEIKTDSDKAQRVFNKLYKILPKKELDRVFIAIRSGDYAKFTVIFNYVVETIKENKDIHDKLSDKAVFNFDRLVSRVLLEAHRFKGFIRFSKAENGVYYAKYFPDSDINTLILPHFISRYKTMPFILHDLNHNVISAYYNGKTKTTKDKIAPLEIDDDFAKLFKIYYDSIFIKERANERLMLNSMPKRYHKYLPEKDELL
ncbi:MAG: TIGR03915 family putative DNA repair protein [Clostridia bacterium]|nr:TIGR03915 family putative DNA repair protein [Clostridia bacterium]